MTRKLHRLPLGALCTVVAAFSVISPQCFAEDWKPTQAQERLLAEEQRFDRYAIRPPSGTKTDHRKVGQEDRHVWALETGGKPTGMVAVTLVDRPGAPQGSLEKGLQMHLDRLKTRMAGFQGGDIETGTLSGQKFARVRFRVDTMPGFPPGPIFGFLYVTQAPDRVIQITGFGTAETIERMEASAQTFRDAKS